MLSQLADKKFDATSIALQKNILGFYSKRLAPVETKKDPGKWQKVQSNLDALKAFTPSPCAAAADAGATCIRLRRADASQFSAKMREECSLCRMPENALGLACCLPRPTG